MRGIGDAFDPTEAGSLRAVYLLAASALGHTHHVDRRILRRLANAVLEAYVDFDFPPLPLSTTQIEDLAVMSIDTMLRSQPEFFVMKH